MILHLFNRLSIFTIGAEYVFDLVLWCVIWSFGDTKKKGYFKYSSSFVWMNKLKHEIVKILHSMTTVEAAEDDETAPSMSFAGFSASERYIAGDSRANEHVGLTAIHIIFVREHNRIAEVLGTQNPEWTDEEIYQTARKYVILQTNKSSKGRSWHNYCLTLKWPKHLLEVVANNDENNGDGFWNTNLPKPTHVK